MPFIHSLTENTIKGTAYASVFGGTTANSEYEFLTGNTTAFLPAGTVPYHLYVKEGSESLVAQMNRWGIPASPCTPTTPPAGTGWRSMGIWGSTAGSFWTTLPTGDLPRVCDRPVQL